MNMKDEEEKNPVVIPQLKMHCYSFEELPKQNIPEGYELRCIKDGDEDSYVEVTTEAFGGERSFEADVIKHVGYYPGGTFFIFKDNKAVATSTAIIDLSPENKDGYLHMVAALKGHQGKGLGLEVSLACLLLMKSKGMTGCTLKTDVFRLPAIATYLKLEFLPEVIDEAHYEIWTKALTELGREDLILYVMGQTLND